MRPDPFPKSSGEIADELLLLDIIKFIQKSWKTITSFAALGIAGAFFFILLTPKQYEVTAQIRVAQLPNSNFNLINIEEPNALISRMKLPTSYSKVTITLCGLADEKGAQDKLKNKVIFTIPKGVGKVVDLRITDNSKDVASACAMAVYQLIKASQDELLTPYIEAARREMVILQKRENRLTELFKMRNKMEPVSEAIFLLGRNDIDSLSNQIASINNLVNSVDSFSTKLTAPIYINDDPVAPKKLISLLVGLLCGGFLGLLIALIQNRNLLDKSAKTVSL
jgi:capsular polysaccharide biosynthesis protein